MAVVLLAVLFLHRPPHEYPLQFPLPLPQNHPHTHPLVRVKDPKSADHE